MFSQLGLCQVKPFSAGFHPRTKGFGILNRIHLVTLFVTVSVTNRPHETIILMARHNNPEHYNWSNL
jgi:hypothetical protein